MLTVIKNSQPYRYLNSGGPFDAHKTPPPPWILKSAGAQAWKESKPGRKGPSCPSYREGGYNRSRINSYSRYHSSVKNRVPPLSNPVCSNKLRIETLGGCNFGRAHEWGDPSNWDYFDSAIILLRSKVFDMTASLDCELTIVSFVR